MLASLLVRPLRHADDVAQLHIQRFGDFPQCFHIGFCPSAFNFRKMTSRNGGESGKDFLSESAALALLLNDSPDDSVIVLHESIALLKVVGVSLHGRACFFRVVGHLRQEHPQRMVRCKSNPQRGGDAYGERNEAAGFWHRDQGEKMNDSDGR